MQQFLNFYDFLRPVLDILLLAFLLYKGYQLLSKTQALQLAKGAVFLFLVYAIAYLLRLTTMQWVLNIIAPGIFIAIVIIFQPELRKIILHLGQTDFFKANVKAGIGQLEAVITAAEILSGKRRGMLAVFPRRTGLKEIAETGTRINADISSSLIVSIFEFDGPLHDGAMVIQHGRIVAAGCFLPLSEQKDIRRNFGTRHRAALGMSEQSDAVVLVVSEESGAISLACDSRLYYVLSPADISQRIRTLLGPEGRRTADAEEGARTMQTEDGDFKGNGLSNGGILSKGGGDVSGKP